MAQASICRMSRMGSPLRPPIPSRLRSRTSTRRFTADPPFILFHDQFGNGSMTLNWSVPGARLLELHVGSSTGPLLSLQGSSDGWVRAQDWVSDGMKFVLCEVSGGSCSPQNTVATLTASVQEHRERPQFAGRLWLARAHGFPEPDSRRAGTDLRTDDAFLASGRQS